MSEAEHDIEPALTTLRESLRVELLEYQSSGLDFLPRAQMGKATTAPSAVPSSSKPAQPTIAAVPRAQPPAHQPPAHQPPAHQPPAHQPPAHQPPAQQPPVHQPPAHQSPAQQPPVHQPPAQELPQAAATEDPRAEQPAPLPQSPVAEDAPTPVSAAAPGADAATAAGSDGEDEPFSPAAMLAEPPPPAEVAAAQKPQTPAETRASLLEVVQLPNPPKQRLDIIQSEVLGACLRCKLSRGRRQLVFGVGNPSANLVFVGEGPGAEEDRQGVPFVGRAGELLTKMIVAMGLGRDDVYICNVVKCRPPNNRDPEKEEVAACEPFLQAQLAVLEPKVIVGLGRCASQTLLRVNTPIGRLRGRWAKYQGVDFMPTFHPAYLLRSPAKKRDAWTDLQAVMARLEKR